jgi:hypothetical protein
MLNKINHFYKIHPLIFFARHVQTKTQPKFYHQKLRKYILVRYLHLIREICDLGGAVSAVELPGACFQKNNPENWLDLFFFIRRFPPFFAIFGAVLSEKWEFSQHV